MKNLKVFLHQAPLFPLDARGNVTEQVVKYVQMLMRQTFLIVLLPEKLTE